MLEGFLNLRDTQVPVVLLRTLFALPAMQFEMYTPVIVVKAGGGLLGLCADRVTDVERVDEAAFKPVTPGNGPNDCAEAEFVSGEQRCVLLNLDRLLLSEERARIDELSKETERRLAEIEASRR